MNYWFIKANAEFFINEKQLNFLYEKNYIK